jgi:hypothetical protein
MERKRSAGISGMLGSFKGKAAKPVTYRWVGSGEALKTLREAMPVEACVRLARVQMILPRASDSGSCTPLALQPGGTPPDNETPRASNTRLPTRTPPWLSLPHTQCPWRAADALQLLLHP